MNERRFANSKSSASAPNSRENATAKYPVVRVVNKKKRQKSPEDERYLILKEKKKKRCGLKIGNCLSIIPISEGSVRRGDANL